ncbi:MAG: Coenzyme F420 hydrogenase/dehydrogenase, beta subunit C-terminal domain [Archaeoglobaceae archaeon]|nr:Coenzyme F420 hydrogenase/dehydrogenase, beta subunit C-terminal domain [Archaeoglobaceae archaeon]
MLEWEFLLPRKKHAELKFFGNLYEEVIKPGICSHCTACSAICPVSGITAGDKPIDFPNWTELCVDCGACIRVCPRWEYKPLSGLGNFVEIFSAKSKRFVGQDGAMVAEFTITALEEKMVEKAIFVTRDEDWRTKVVSVMDAEYLKSKRITGTKYSFADVMPALKRAILDSKAVAFVGTPCMISALRKMQESFKKFERVKLAIGLFCTENFYHHQLKEFLLEKGVNFKEVLKTDIKKGNFIVKKADGEISFSVKELDNIIPSGCKVCQDFSAVESDVSIGSVGSDLGFSTVIVRSEIAKKIAEIIKAKGYADFRESNLDIVKKLCSYKVKIHPYPPKKERKEENP